VSNRKGIACAGNWVVDHVKVVDRLPARGLLANILSETRGTGGCAFNTLVDLARLGAPFPLAGIGVVGDDSAGDFIRETCRPLGIDMTAVATLPGAATSYTDVITEADSLARTFYHQRGANARFDLEHVPLASLTCRILHLGYLLLLDRLDAPDPEFGTAAARLLRLAQAAGLKTSVDVVSEDSDRFSRIVPAALPYTDYLVLNEIEAGRTTGYAARDARGRLDAGALVEAVEALAGMGRMDCIVVHMPEGAYYRARGGRRIARGSLALPDGFIKGTVGAGDAFCAGMLLALHEDWKPEDALQLGAACATACLTHPSATEGMRPLSEVLDLARRFPERDPPVAV